MAKQILETEHAKVFLDVVFGVVIALPMAQLPQLVQRLALAPSHALITRRSMDAGVAPDLCHIILCILLARSKALYRRAN